MFRLMIWGTLCVSLSAQTMQVRVSVGSQGELDALIALDVDLGCSCGRASHPGHDADVLIRDPADLGRLVAAGFSPVVVHQDLETFYRSRLQQFQLDGGVPAFGQGSMGGYFTFTEIVAFLDDLQGLYPHLMAPKVSIGTSLEGRDLWMWKISDNPLIDEGEPEILIDALHHAREAGTVMSVAWLAKTLLEGYATDEDLRALVDRRELYLVPVVNPDGFVHNETTNPAGGGLWRKNRRPNTGGSFGVDLNRNYGYLWGLDNSGSSPTPTSEVYRGTGPFSEPESLAMKAFAESRNLRVNHSLHSYSNLVCLPPSHQLGVLPTPPLDAHYAAMTVDLQALPPGYVVGSTPQILYAVNGGSVDWYLGSLYGGLQVYAFLTEQGSSTDGFWPPSNRIEPLAREATTYALYLARVAGADLRVGQVAVTDIGGAVPDVWEPGETLQITATVSNGGSLADLATLRVEPLSPWLQGATSQNLGVLDAFEATSVAGSVAVTLLPGTPYGVPVAFELVADAPNAVPYRVRFERVIGSTPVTVVDDDFESPSGWIVGAPGDTATAGIWTRQDPIGTTNQGAPFNPEDDHTPTPGVECWFTGQGAPGGAAGTQDVDGTTTLLSPTFDLTNVADPRLTYWLWFATTGADSLEVGLSNDGGTTWTVIETLNADLGGWTERSFNLESILPRTNAMRLFFRAADEPNNSLCEAALDDLRITGRTPGLAITTTGTAAPGTTLALDLQSPWFQNRPYAVGISLSAATGIALPAGLMPLDPDPLFFLAYQYPAIFASFTGIIDPGGQGQAFIHVPPDPALSGAAIFTAAGVFDGAAPLTFTGALRVVIP